MRGALGGWDLVRARLNGQDGAPMLYAFSTCVDMIRTLPVLQHDPDRPEDLDTEAEDHAADEVRYACASRPWTASMTKKPDTKTNTRKPTMDELMREYEREKRFIGNRI